MNFLFFISLQTLLYLIIEYFLPQDWVDRHFKQSDSNKTYERLAPTCVLLLQISLKTICLLLIFYAICSSG